MPLIQTGVSVMRLASSSDASTTAAAPSETGETSSLFTGQTRTSLLSTSSTFMLGSQSWADGWPQAFLLFFTATRAMSSFLTLHLYIYRCISMANIQSRFGFSGFSTMGSHM
jgi:hypothetical protein